MPYATQQDLVDRFGAKELIQLTDRTSVPPAVIDAAVVAQALADASALVDGYVGRVAALPLAVVPPVLVRVTCDIARAHLHGKAAEEGGAVDRAYKEAIRILRDVADRRIELDAGGSAPTPAAGGVRATAGDPVFSRDSLKAF